MNLSVFIMCLRAFTRRKPFRPFVIELVGGDQLSVRHPEAVTIRGEAIQITMPDGGYQVLVSASVSRFLDIPRSQPIELP